MIPFCRTPEEGKKVIEIMRKFGMVQGEDGLEIYVMCEIPSNVILADQFAEIFDGFSIGTNDLTQLALGVDRDSSLVSHIYDERNEAVKRLVKHVIDVAKQKGKKMDALMAQGLASARKEYFKTADTAVGINKSILDKVLLRRIR